MAGAQTLMCLEISISLPPTILLSLILALIL